MSCLRKFSCGAVLLFVAQQQHVVTIAAEVKENEDATMNPMGAPAGGGTGDVMKDLFAGMEGNDELKKMMEELKTMMAGMGGGADGEGGLGGLGDLFKNLGMGGEPENKEEEEQNREEEEDENDEQEEDAEV